MRTISFIALLLMPFTAPLFAFDIVKDGKALCIIVTSDNPDPAEATAAAHLAQYLNESTGATLKVKTESDSTAGEAQILVGPSNRAKSSLPTTDFTRLGPDSIVIKTVSPYLILAGPTPRGTLYAVYTFLEDQVGVRWWTSIEELVPKRATLAVDKLDTTYTPPLRYREAYNYDPIHDALFATHLKLNGHMTDISPALGGHMQFLGWCHTAYSLMPPEKYFKDHPEWYSLVKGKRTTQLAQLCFTNKEMQKELARNALEWIRKNPSAGIISISQNDCIGNCECDNCKAADAEQGTPAGSLLVGINAVAAEIARKYPNFLIETLAYQHTRHPPKTLKPAPNVLIRLCSIEADGAHNLDSANNKAFGDDLRGWAKLADNLFIWNYVTNFNFATIPHPNFYPLGPDLRFFVANKVVGVFEQGDAGNFLAGDMLPLRVWLLAHLMWDPSKDQDALIKEFMDGYYGAAGPHMRAYLDTVNAPAKSPNFGANCFNQNLAYLTNEMLATCHKEFDDAEAAVRAQPIFLSRVKRDRLVLESLEIQRYDISAHIAELKKTATHPDQATRDAVNQYEVKASDWAARAILAGMRYHDYNFAMERRATEIITRGRGLLPKPTTTPTSKSTAQ